MAISPKKLAILLAFVFSAITLGQGYVSALSPEQNRLFKSGIQYYESNSTTSSCSTTSSTTTSGGLPSSYATSEVTAFARQPITATWNIADSTIEQWYLEQGSAKVRVDEFGLTSNNISEITSAVKAAGVSPVFFYGYAVTEGGGNGGFINHYTNSEPGGGVANAKKDAEYIASQSQKTYDDPAWFDYGPPRGPDFVPKDIQEAGNADFKSMPLGTIGRVIIPATAAAAWSVYYPDGLKKEFNQVGTYGAPIQGIMNSIKKLGGDPMDGGAIVSSGSCTSTVTGEGMTKAINWAVMIANNNGYGYDQNTRTSGWEKWQSDPSCTTNCGSLDCSSLVSAALTEAGYFTTNPNFSTSGLDDALEKAGFTKLTVSFETSKDLLPGDILNSSGSHTEIYIGNDQTVGAHQNENKGINGGKVGDQTGDEISVVPYKNHPWKTAWRAPAK